MVAFTYKVMTIEECFTLYHNQNMACECDGDNKKVIFRKE